jgi:hypothetical protein
LKCVARPSSKNQLDLTKKNSKVQNGRQNNEILRLSPASICVKRLFQIT